jgi:hypothetical protein
MLPILLHLLRLLLLLQQLPQRALMKLKSRVTIMIPTFISKKKMMSLTHPKPRLKSRPLFLRLLCLFLGVLHLLLSFRLVLRYLVSLILWTSL